MYKIILPGELIAAKPLRAEGIDVRNGKSYATVIGVYDDERQRFTPLKGVYFPAMGDTVIGLVEEERGIGYEINIFAPWSAFLPTRGLRTHFSLGDVVIARVAAVTEIKAAQLTRAHRLSGGELTFISPVKVSRLIGRKLSMVRTIEDTTKCKLDIGQNGVIYIKGSQAAIRAVKSAVAMIDREAHIPGLTDRVQKFLTEAMAKEE